MIVDADVAYTTLVMPFIIAGIGMALFFAPVANVVLSACGRQEQGQASGANNAMRELGGVFGVAVLASIFAHYGGYGTAQTFVDGLTPALWVGAGVRRPPERSRRSASRARCAAPQDEEAPSRC